MNFQTKYLPPYQPDGSTTFPRRMKAGVYLIKKDGVLRYIGFSGVCLYRTLYRHFQSWDDPKQVRVTYKPKKGEKITVRVVYLDDRERAPRLERALILKHRPPDNPDKLENYQLTTQDRNTIEAASKIREDCPF